MAKSNTLSRPCARWLQRHVSDVDYGWSRPEITRVSGRHTSELLGANYRLRKRRAEQKAAGTPVDPCMPTPSWRGKFYGLRPLSQAEILSHLAKQETIYYTSRRSLNEALLMFDFDWHDDHKAKHGRASDAMRAAQFIQNVLFPDWKTYLESSTGGFGAHLFVRVDCSFVASRMLNDDLATMTNRIKQMIRNEGFVCDFCGIYGNFTIIDEGIVAKGGMGRLGKLPRPQSASQMRNLMGINPIPYNAFAWASNDAVFDVFAEELGCDLPQQKSSNSVEFDATPTPPNVPSHLAQGQSPSPTSMGSSESLGSNSIQQDVYCEDSDGTPASIIVGVHGGQDPNRRMFGAVYALARILNCPPTVDDAVRFYEAAGLHTGPDIKGRRVRRAEDAVRSCQASFRAFQRQGVLRYLRLVKDRLTDGDLRNSGCPRAVTFEDVAVGLYIITGRLQRRQANPDYQHTVSQSYVVAAFRNLKAAGLYNRLCDKRKWAAIKRLLLKAGLIEFVLGPGCYRTGIAEEFYLGAHHPAGATRAVPPPIEPGPTQHTVVELPRERTEPERDNSHV